MIKYRNIFVFLSTNAFCKLVKFYFFKHLGIYLSPTFSWSVQIKEVLVFNDSYVERVNVHKQLGINLSSTHSSSVQIK